MTTTNYLEATKAVAKLTREERIQLRKHLGVLIGLEPSAGVAVQSSFGGARAVVGQLLKFAKSIGLSERDSTIAAIDQLLNSRVGKGSIEKCESVWSFVSGQTDDRLKREALLTLGFRLNYDELRTWIDVVGVNEMLQFMDRVPAAVDSQFPGYAQYGLLAMVVSAKKR